MCGVTDRAFKGTNRLSFRLTQSDFLCIAVRCWNADDPKAAPAEPEEALLRDFCTLCERPNPGSFADASVLLPAGAFPAAVHSDTHAVTSGGAGRQEYIQGVIPGPAADLIFAGEFTRDSGASDFRLPCCSFGGPHRRDSGNNSGVEYRARRSA